MSRSVWAGIVSRELSRSVRSKTPITLAVTLRSSVRFVGSVSDVPEYVLTLQRRVGNDLRSTYVDLDEVAAIEVL